MKKFDVYLQQQRFKKASEYIVDGAVLADVGCRDGKLFEFLGSRIKYGYGFDPYLDEVVRAENYILNPQPFKRDTVTPSSLDCITLLAVLEHLETSAIDDIVSASSIALKPNGRIVITVPDAKVDHILKVLEMLQIIEGQSLEEHHGYDTRRTREIFEDDTPFIQIAHERFQFGLNNLFVFERRPS